MSKICVCPPYRPANGTEGAYFQADFCDRCKHDQGYQRTLDATHGCPILLATLLFQVDDPEYPREWIWENGIPKCTKFEPEEASDD